MKKFAFFALAAILLTGITLISCGGDDDGDNDGGGGGKTGSLTITDIDSEYNGNYIGGTGYGPKSIKFKVGESLSGSDYVGAKITDGKVTLKVWKEDGNENWVNYNGNDGPVLFMLNIHDEPSESSQVVDMISVGAIFVNGHDTVSMLDD